MAFRLFDRWARTMGLQDAVLEGIDLPLEGGTAAHRAAVQALKLDATIQGALITAHKLSVVRAAGDLIDVYTQDAQDCQEVSALYKRGGSLWGDACDAATSGLALSHFLGPQYWRAHPEAEILSLGGGGATVALKYYLLTRAPWRPRRLTIVDIREDNLAHCQVVAAGMDRACMQIAYKLSTSATYNDALVEKLPPHSVVVNATGLGKDRPGSPVTDAVRFPEYGAAWELNYRGARPFLHQARRQQRARALQVTDGWHYFLLGWSSVLARVFDFTLTQDRFAAFCAASGPVRNS